MRFRLEVWFNNLFSVGFHKRPQQIIHSTSFHCYSTTAAKPVSAIHLVKSNLSRRVLFPFLLFVLLGGFGFSANAQVGDQTLTTIASWNAYVHLPDDYAANPTQKYPVIVFIAGVGEVGTDPSKMLVYGPSYYIKQGHNMQFTVNNVVEKPIVISLQPAAAWPNPQVINTRVDSIMKRWRIDPTRFYVTGLSMGGMAWDNYITGGDVYAKKITAIVAMSAVEPNNPLTNLRPFALNGGKWWGFEGTTDYRKMDLIRDTLNRIVPGSARYTQYVGGHCCWNTWYNPTWTENGDNIYTWLLKQKLADPVPDNNIPPQISNVTPETSIVLPTSSLTLSATATDPDGTIASYTWTKISGPSQFTIASPTANSTLVSSLVEGSYSFSVSAKDNKGATVLDTVKVNVLAAGTSSNCGCDYIIKPNQPTDNYIYVNVKNAGIKPGAKVCIPAGVYDHISIEGLIGTEANPITIVNCGGQVVMNPVTSYGFRMVKSRYFRLTGTGTPGVKYGFKIHGIGDGTPPGLAMADSMTHFEIDHFEASNISAGFYIKTQPKDCDPGSWEGAWEMKNMSFHDNYIHHSTGEGFYLGHTAITFPVIDCSGASINVGTQTMRNMKVYNNILDSLGWDGIQVAGVLEGAEIYNNIVTNYGLENKSSQQGGILLGGRCNGKVYNNIVRKGTGNGIQVFAFGTNYVYNNLVIDAGNAGQDGVYIDDRPAAGLPGAKLIMVNNTIVRAGNIGIKLSNNNNTYLNGNIFSNNLIVQPGLAGKYSSAYISTFSTGAATLSNNSFLATVPEAGFVDTANYDFRLLKTSPAVNAGINTASYGVTKDLADVPRPSGTAYDIGTYEFVENNLLAPPATTSNGDYSTIVSCMAVSTIGWTTFYDPKFNPIFEMDRNGQNISKLCWSNRIVTNKLRGNKGYFGNASIQTGAFFQRNYLLDKKGSTAGVTTKLRLLVGGAELTEFVDAYNQKYGTSCTVADVRVVQYTGKNADLEFGNNILTASLYTSITPTIVSYGTGNSLRYLEFSTTPDGEFWIALNVTPVKPVGIDQTSGTVGGSGASALQAWFRADKGTNISVSKIASWNDLSGNARTASQANIAAQPSLVTASAALNNQAAVSFSSSALDLPMDINTGKTPFLTVYTVALHNTNSLASKLWGHDAGNYGRGAGLHENAGGGFALSYLDGSTPASYGTISTGKGFISKNSYSPVSVVSSMNGQTDVVDNNLVNVEGKTTMTIGNVTSLSNNPTYSEYWNGQISEVMVFNSLLSVAQETIIENYLSARYNLPIATARNIYVMDDTTNGNYDQDVLGIGMATDNSAVLEASGLDMIGLSNPANLGVDEWLFIGSNGKPNSDSMQTLVPSGIQSKLKKEWRVGEKGDVGRVDLQFNVSSIAWVGSAGDIKLLIDVNNNGSFTDETVAGGGIVSGEWLASGIVAFKGVSIANGQRLTLGFAPGLAIPSTTYYFNGTGNFSDPANWRDGKVPTDNIAGMNEIIIDPSSGSCVLDVPFTLKTGMKLTVMPGKNMIVKKL
ncbi:MAG TPA: right-handed parallel beta-helix repeat-containing protein [Phnomibacter sp.]|nr:right-handed parallel beta-helix repeat-containing protein [Phnomibacter sp.]